jgi:hypothetical protein
VTLSLGGDAPDRRLFTGRTLLDCCASWAQIISSVLR